MAETKELPNGCLGIWEQDTDFLLCWWFDDALPTLYKQDEVRYFYNQYAYSWSKVSCTIFAAAGMLSDLMNYQFSEKELKEMDEMSYERGRIRGQGWYVQSAVKCVADWWNERMKDKVAFYRISKYDDDVIENVISKFYTLDTNYNWSKAYWEDKKDWVLDGTDFWPYTYWHSIDIIMSDWKRCVKDSWSTNKVYEVKHKLSEIKCFWNFLYLYTKVAENAIDEVKRLNEFKTNLIKTIELNSTMRHQSNDSNYKSILHYVNEKNRKKLQDCDAQLAKYM